MKSSKSKDKVVNIFDLLLIQSLLENAMMQVTNTDSDFAYLEMTLRKIKLQKEKMRSNEWNKERIANQQMANAQLKGVTQ